MNMIRKMSKGRTEATGSVSRYLDALPVAVMTCDLKTFKIDYANPKSVELLEGIRHELGIEPSAIVGTCIDTFHKAPEHQRKLLSDPKNLPHTAQIKLGKEILDLQISAIYDETGRYIKPLLTWYVVTDRVRKEQETERLLQMIDKMPVAVMTCDKDTFEINYANRTSIETLGSIEEHLPIKAKDLMGCNIDIFHKTPSHQRALLSDPSNLPHTANIRVGPEVLNLRVSAMMDEGGAYIGPMLTWSIITSNIRMAESVTSVIDAMSTCSDDMNGAAQQLVTTAGQADERATAVSAAAEELNASISEISTQISTSSEKIGLAVNEARQTNELVTKLADTAARIGSVVNLINDIAAQTNLLALNATIEAARAGEAGKGFAVVAGEVKNLANQTGKATSEISSNIEEMQNVTKSAVDAIQRIGDMIEEVNGISTQIAAAAEQQSYTTSEVAQNITGVADAASETGTAAARVQEISSEIDQRSQSLSGEVSSFLDSRN